MDKSCVSTKKTLTDAAMCISAIVLYDFSAKAHAVNILKRAISCTTGVLHLLLLSIKC
jgi:hypothetical protein